MKPTIGEVPTYQGDGTMEIKGEAVKAVAK